MIKRILIASDFLMTKEKEQFLNRRWMRDLLSRPIERATGLMPVTLASSRSDAKLINRTDFFAASDIQVDLDETQFWFDASRITDASLELLAPFVSPNDLVIGYELSEQTRSVLDRMGVQWIDLWLHPVRFMDDVLFCFNAKSEGVRALLFERDVPAELMGLYADRIKVQTYKGWRRVEADVLPKSALFVGQMLNDKSVLCDGRMLSVLDFKDQFEQIAAEHSRVYYSRHPYMKQGDAKILKWISTLPNVALTNEASYRLLSSDRIRTVFSLSSSVVEEARFFGKNAFHLYRPVVRFGDPRDPMSGASILHDFVSPRFWADILAPLLPTDSRAPHVAFTDPKDKIRDMLGFFWSYHDIDKTENMRRRLTDMTDILRPKPALAPVAKVAPTPVFEAPKGFMATSGQIKGLKDLIAGHDVISFDVFDTLVERVVDAPNDLFAILAPRIEAEIGNPFPDFAEARRKARDLAIGAAKGEEVLLKDRYEALAAHCGMDATSARKMLEIELDGERCICRPRDAGLLALRYALEKKRRVILVSDIFFDRAFVEELLRQTGVTGWHRLYLSSEEGLVKHTGRLFDVVLKEEKTPSDRILHIGDNAKADIEMAKSRGLSTFHLEDKSRISARLGKTMKAFETIADVSTRSLVKGLVARKLAAPADGPKIGATSGRADVLGYALMGPAFAGFATWIKEQASARNITDIFFLARDGDIAKRCYDIVTAGREAPRSHYIMASRRALGVSSLYEAEDLQRLLERNFTPSPIGVLIANRFGICPASLPVGVFADHGFGSPAGLADWRTNKKGIKAFFADERIVGPVLANSTEERNLLLRAYRDMGLHQGARNVAFVDIGHSGSLQAAICKLLGLEATTGLYFATKEDAGITVGKGHEAIGYVVNGYRDANRQDLYRKHILMYELMFQNTEGSFLRYHEKGGALLAETVNVSGEERRIAMIKDVHEEACRFTADLHEVVRDLGLEIRISGREAISAMSEMLSAPYPQDANLFKGIYFENRYSARDMTWILPPKGQSGKAVWLEGASALAAAREKQLKATNLLFSLVRMMTPIGPKREKLERDPKRFFSESRYSFLRPLAHLVKE